MDFTGDHMWWIEAGTSNDLFDFHMLKFNSHHINIAANVWSTKRKLIACMSAQIRSNLRDESIKPKIENFLSNKTKVLQYLLNFNTSNQTGPKDRQSGGPPRMQKPASMNHISRYGQPSADHIC
jgi:hypothetical protein